MKWLWNTLMFFVMAVAYTACGDNPIESKSGSDSDILATYVDASDGMVDKIDKAMADCLEDPACRALMDGVDGENYTPQEESSSSVAADTSSVETESSSSKKGPVIPSSSSIQTANSSAGGSSNSTGVSSASVASSGSTVVSSSSKGSSILNGACNAIPSSVERGGSVTWKYVSLNTSLVIESYDWTFDEGSSITTSKDASPSVSYAAKGKYGASVTINKGLDTEKTVGCTNPVDVTGIKVTGCTCTTSSTSVVVSSSKPKDVTWSVSGCTGAEPFTYAWAGGASGKEASASMTISSVGSHAPTVTITNSDGMTMSPTCNPVSASEMPGAVCNVGEHNYDANKTSLSVVPEQTFYFKPDNVTGVTGTMSMTLAGGGSSKTISVANGTNNSATAVTAPAELGTYPYTLSVDGEEVCSANVTVEYPQVTASCSFASSALPGGSVKFNVGSLSGWTDAMGSNASMTLSGNSTSQNITVNRYSNGGFSITAPSELGSYDYILTYGGNQVCKATMKVEYPAVTASCSFSSGNSMLPGGSVTFTASSWSGWTDGMGNSVTMLLNGEGANSEGTAGRYGNFTKTFTAPTELGSYDYTLTYGGNQVCKVTLAVAWPNITSSKCAIGKNVYSSGKDFFTPGDSFSGWGSGISSPQKMTLYLDDEIVVEDKNVTNGYNGPQWQQVTLPTEPGTYTYRLDYHGNTVCEVEYEVE